MSEKNLTVSSIYEQEFKIKMRGYDAVEVDAFLDLVMQDYETYENELAALRQEIVQLRSQRSNTTSETVVSPEHQTGTTNYDILRRISNLEKHVFGAKLDAE